LSEDWIPVPEIENVLIVLAALSEDPIEIEAAPVMNLLARLKDWRGGSVYVFHQPPEAGEVLEDVDPEMAAKFALAAQMSDVRAEVCRDAFRRVFSRAAVQRVVLINDMQGRASLEEIDQLFHLLDSTDILWAGEWPGRFAVGMRSWHGEIFLDIEQAEINLRNTVEQAASARGLRLEAVHGF
jgi:hypothetical protein